MTDRETFYLQDNPTLIFESRQPDPYRFDDPDGIPANPIEVEYKMYNRTDAELFTTTDGQSVFTEDSGFVEVEPANLAEDRGAIIRLRFHPEATIVAGGYTLYITSIFADGVRITDNYRIDIAEYR